MKTDLPRPRPSSLGVGKSVIRRTRNAESAGAEPAAQTTNMPTFEEFFIDRVCHGGAMYGRGAGQPLGVLTR